MAMLSMEFAVVVSELSDRLIAEKESIISKQIGKSGTSIGANIRESEYAQSRADFISKLQIALKEAGETDFWLELLFRLGRLEEAEYQKMADMCSQLIAMLTASINTASEKTTRGLK